MRENWTYKKLGEVATFINGYAFKPDQWKDSGTPIVRIQNLNNPEAPYNYYDGEVPDKVKIKDGDLLISWSASLGTYIWKGGDAFLNQHIFKVEFNKLDVDKMFLKYAVTSKLDAMAQLVHGATMKHIVKKDFDNTLIPYPSLSVQQSIVSELDKINELMSLKKAQLSDLDALAQSIFYDMFGDIDDDTPLSHFISSLGGGKSLAGKDSCINKVLKTGAVSFDYFDGNSVKDLPLDYVPLQEHLLKDGDLLVSRMNTPELVGSCAYVWKAPNNTYLPDRLWRATLKQGNNPIYLWFSIIQLKSKEQIRSLASGTSGSMKNISKPRFLSVKIKNAPLSLQQDFAKRIELIEQQKAQISSTIKDLETLLASRMQYWFD